MIYNFNIMTKVKISEEVLSPACPVIMDESVLKKIGNTPLIPIRNLTRDYPDVEIYAKAEWRNAGGSVKSRPALQMIEDAEADGSLQPDQTVVELTSGNTGTGLAIVCAVKGYPFVAVMSKGRASSSPMCRTRWARRSPPISRRMSARITASIFFFASSKPPSRSIW